VHYDQFQTIAPGEFCYEAHLIRVLDENPPRFVATTGRQFLLDADGSVVEAGSVVLGAGPGFAHAVAATNDWLYALRPDGKVFSLVRVGVGGAAHDEWEDISSGPAPQGLAGQRCAMIAASPNYVYALTRSERVYARIPGTNNSRVWEMLSLPSQELPIDLRSIGGSVYAESRSGTVYQRDPGRWTLVP
jgi:hypothetical protein